MKPSVKGDLEDMADILEGFMKRLDTMSVKDQIDLVARLQPAKKHIEKMDKAVRDLVKEKLGHKEGTLLGEQFAAVLKEVPTDRFKQSEFKEARPSMYAQYVRQDIDERVSFELR